MSLAEHSWTSIVERCEGTVEARLANNQAAFHSWQMAFANRSIGNRHEQ